MISEKLLALIDELVAAERADRRTGVACDFDAALEWLVYLRKNEAATDDLLAALEELADADREAYEEDERMTAEDEGYEPLIPEPSSHREQRLLNDYLAPAYVAAGKLLAQWWKERGETT